MESEENFLKKEVLLTAFPLYFDVCVPSGKIPITFCPNPGHKRNKSLGEVQTSVEE